MIATILAVLSCATVASAGDQPVAVFHAFNQSFEDIEKFVCELPKQGYSHVQIPPAQKSSAVGDEWYFRYQPVDFDKIEGRGTEADLKSLVNKAHGCKVKVIADVVFNHMTSEAAFATLDKFPGLKPSDFHNQCPINYSDGNSGSEMFCWLNGDLPDLKQEEPAVRDLLKKHLKKLLNLGIDGFRFDAAKHMEAQVVKELIDYVDQQSRGDTWNYLEVIEDSDTRLENYNWIAAVTDFRLYSTLKSAFAFNGDLRSLRVAQALNDSRSVTFGGNHDTRQKIADQPINSFAINPCDRPTDASDCHLADAYVLARESGTPVILNDDNLVPYIPIGVKFRQVMQQRGKEGKKVRENVLAVIDSRTLLIMERGEEGFFVVNKSTSVFDTPVLDLTLTNLEGCYRELRGNFAVLVQRNADGRKFVTRWGTPARGGMEVHARDALYFIREPLSVCK
ncbi:MAG: alpha-amylase family glycosyl hydrolase [Polyangiaceae bacterium]